MQFGEIRPNSREDVRRYLEGKAEISGETYGMLAHLFDDFEDGVKVVHELVNELGVKVTGRPYT